VNHPRLDTATSPPSAFIRGAAYDALDRTLLVVKSILVEAAADRRRPVGTRTQNIGAFYASCMDSLRAETDGIRPLAASLSDIDAAQTPGQVALAAARLQEGGTAALFGVSVAVDQRDSRRLVLALAQGGLGLPDRDYYLRSDSAAATLRAAYLESMTRTFELAGTGPV